MKIFLYLELWSFILVLAVVLLKAPLFRQEIVSSSECTVREVAPTV